MVDFFKNDTKLSMGRLLTFLLFIVVTVVFCVKAFTSEEITTNITSLIQWGWLTSLGGKALQAAAEKIGQKK